MDSMEVNKIAAAIFTAGIIALGTGLVIEGVYDPQPHGDEVKRGYEIEVVETADAGAVVDKGPEQIAAYFVHGDMAKGEKLTKACLACHSFNKGGANKVGPNLYGVVGAKKARVADYSYSNALASYGGEWDYQALSEFLTKPKKYIDGTKMAYAGMKKPEDRASILLYMRSMADAPVPLPEAPVEEEPDNETDAELVPTDETNPVVPAADGSDEMDDAPIVSESAEADQSS